MRSAALVGIVTAFALTFGLLAPGCGSTCGPANCAGCCGAGGACETPSASACGVNGATCSPCSDADDICFNGECLAPGDDSNGTTTGPSSNSGTSATNGSSGTTGGSSSSSTSSSTTNGSSSTTNGSSSTTNGTSASTTSTTTSTTGSSASSAPVISSLSANPTTIGPGGQTVISAIVSDAAGNGSLAGGTLSDAVTGASYGAFTTPGGQGTFTYPLSWDAIDQMHTIGNLAPGGSSRTVVAKFFDNQGHTVSQSLTLDLGCSPSGDAVCSEACVDLKTDSSNCGSCGNAAPINGSCVNGAPTCPQAGQQVCNGLCTDLQADGLNCGSCGNSCGVWGETHLSAQAQVLCIAGACAAFATGTGTQSCSTVCAQAGTGLSCYDHESCQNADGSKTPATSAGCAFYESSGGVCQQQVALACATVPAATLSSCNGSNTVMPGCLCSN